MNLATPALDVAENLLLAPYGLDERALERAFGTLMRHRLDYADLYFQYRRAEGWSLEEGIVKSGSFDIEQGVGVRAISGEKTAFAYSDDISEAALEDAARATRAGSHQRRAGGDIKRDGVIPACPAGIDHAKPRRNRDSVGFGSHDPGSAGDLIHMRASLLDHAQQRPDLRGAGLAGHDQFEGLNRLLNRQRLAGYQMIQNMFHEADTRRFPSTL